MDTPTCEAALFLQADCPVATQVGVTTQIAIITAGDVSTYLEPVYNLAPEPGQVAKIGFNIADEYHYEGDIAVRAPGEGVPVCGVGRYGVRSVWVEGVVL